MADDLPLVSLKLAPPGYRIEAEVRISVNGWTQTWSTEDCVVELCEEEFVPSEFVPDFTTYAQARNKTPEARLVLHLRRFQEPPSVRSTR